MEKRTFGLMSGMLLALVGCGGDSSDSKDSVGADVKVTTAVTDAGPRTLTTTTYSGDNTTVELNQKASGTINSDGYYQDYLFTAQQSGYISIMLEGSASDKANLDLDVSDLDGTLNADGVEGYWATSNSGSKELAIIMATQGHQYEITIENVGDVDSEDYTLTVANLSRDMLGLKEGEYLTVSSEKGSETCVKNGASYKEPYSFYWVEIANFKSGYFYSLEDRLPMTSVSESGFKAAGNYSNSYTEDDVSENISTSINLVGTFDNNKTSANLTYSQTKNFVKGKSDTEECTSSATGTMKFIL